METHPKVWGEELWIANNADYCGKKLILKKGYRCSYHYHKIKHETFYVQSGLVEMKVEGAVVLLMPGDRFELPPMTKHSFYGVEDSEIFEFSTQHMESDSYREDRSCQVATENKGG